MEQAVTTKSDVIHRIAECGRQLHRFGVTAKGLFGSFSRDEATEQSDVDVLVTFVEGRKTFDNFMDTCFLLENKLRRKVEVVTEESLSPYIKPYIMKGVEYVPLPD